MLTRGYDSFVSRNLPGPEIISDPDQIPVSSNRDSYRRSSVTDRHPIKKRIKKYNSKNSNQALAPLKKKMKKPSKSFKRASSQVSKDQSTQYDPPTMAAHLQTSKPRGRKPSNKNRISSHSLPQDFVTNFEPNLNELISDLPCGKFEIQE